MRLKICFLFFLFAFTINLYAQLSATDYKSNEYLRFKASKTYVVKTGDKDFDNAMAAALNECWKVTQFDFIDQEQLKKMIDDKAASFIVVLTNTISEPAWGIQSEILGLISGGKRKLSLYDLKDMLAYTSIEHYKNDTSFTYSAPMIKNMLQCMVNTIDIVEKNDIKGDDVKMMKRLTLYYKTQSYKIKDRVLLINKVEIEKQIDENEFTNIYPYKFEFCTQQKIDGAIRNKDKNFYYLKVTALGNLGLFIFDPASGEVVYGDLLFDTRKVKKKHIKDMADVIGRK